MITFDNLTLAAFVKEQKDFFVGARISKIQQPTRREFIFSLRNFGETKSFYVNINPAFYHLCFANKKNLANRVIEIPKNPPMFCMLLRKYLENSRIAKIEHPDNERIFELYIDSYNELGDKIYLCLAIELMGKHSNVILYNTDTGIIIGCAHNVGAEKSREREIYGGIPYVYPPKQIKSDFMNYNGELSYESLAQDFYMISANFAKSCYGLPIDRIKSFLKLENLSPAILDDFKSYSLYSELLEGKSFRFDKVNDMIDAYYSYYIALEKFNSKKSLYKTLVSQKLKKTVKSLKQMEYKLKADSDCDKYRLYGDLLMANLYNLPNFSDTVEVFDYENNCQLRLDLNPIASVKDNANAFYKLYNKSKSAKEKLEVFIQDYKMKIEYFEQILYSINMAENLFDLDEISSEVVPDNKLVKKKDKSKPIIDIEKIPLEYGGCIYIGKNNKQNDYIISKIADVEDWWFHVHNCAGSHILLKNVKNPSDELIFKCAKLAKEYSTASESAKVGVIYTKRKYLRKPPGANLGYVTYRNEQEIVV